MEYHSCMGDTYPDVQEYYLRHRRFPHIAYTEHHITLTLDNALQPIEGHPHDPESLKESVIPLRIALSDDIGGEDWRAPLRQEKPVLKRNTLKYIQEAAEKVKEKPLGEALEVLKKGSDVDPYPERMRPLRTELTFKSILLHTARESHNPLPSHPSDLVNPESIYRVLTDAGIPIVIEEKLDLNAILKLRLRITAAQAAGLETRRTKMMEGMKRAEARLGPRVEEAAIWKEWNEEYEEVQRSMPRPITPPFSPLVRQPYISLDSMSQLAAPASAEDPPMGRKELGRVLAVDAAGGSSLGVGEALSAARRMNTLGPRGGSTAVSAKPTKLHLSPRLGPSKSASNPEAMPWSKAIQQDRLALLQPLSVPHTQRGLDVYRREGDHERQMYDGRQEKEWGGGHHGGGDGRSNDMGGQIGGRMSYHLSNGNHYTDHQQWSSEGSSQTVRSQPSQYPPRPPRHPSPYAEFGDCLPDHIWPQGQHWHGHEGQEKGNGARIINYPSVGNTTIHHPYPPNHAGLQDGGANAVAQPPRRKRVRDAALPDLNALVAKRAKLDHGGHAERAEPPKPEGFDTSANLLEFVAARTGRVRSPLSTFHPNVGARLSEPEYETPIVVKPHWRLNPLLQNARWYDRVISRPPSSDPKHPKHALATISLMHNVPLIAALKRETFDMIDEDRPTISGADFALSPTTGILFRPLVDLVAHSQGILDDIATATSHYIRVIVIFEVKSYGIKPTDPDVTPTDDPDPLPPGALRALSMFTDTISRRNAMRAKGGEVKLAFGLNGPGEVARVVRAMADHQGQNSVLDPNSAWLEGNQDEEERILEEHFGVNLYAARAILSRFSPLIEYISRWTDKEVVEQLKPVVGGELAERIVQMRAAGRHPGVTNPTVQIRAFR